jgi:non-canonical purine NTP pyrophosphatase (RdgB/HAM1 family)
LNGRIAWNIPGDVYILVRQGYIYDMEAITFLTGSQEKFAEAQAVLPDLIRWHMDLPEIQDIDPRNIIQAKLAEASRHMSGAIVVEDTSLAFDALNGLPGPLIKWFLQRLGVEGLAHLPRVLGNDKASARTVVGYRSAAGVEAFFEAVIPGRIVSPQGAAGFGWDALFLPDGQDKTFAQMSAQEKNAISMRRLAFEQLKDFLYT